MKSSDPISSMNAPDFLVESIPNELHASTAMSQRRLWVAPMMPFLISSLAGGLCFYAGGVSLGLFLGGLLLTAMATAPFVAAENSALGGVLAVLGMIHGVAIVWLYTMLKAPADLSGWLSCYLVLTTMIFAIGGASAALRAMQLGPITSGAICTLLAIAWLTWPVWLSPALHGEPGARTVSWLVPANPIFAINGVLRERFGHWAEQGIAYNFTNLGDDIPYSIPHGVWKCVLLHAVIGAAGFILLATRRRQTQP
jgi:hypothetical protein